MKSTKYGLQQFPSCQIGRIGLAEKGIHFIQKTIKSLVVFNYSLYVYENNAITIRPCKMQSSKPYKFKDTVGLSFLGDYFAVCSNVPIQNHFFQTLVRKFTLKNTPLYNALQGIVFH